MVWHCMCSYVPPPAVLGRYYLNLYSPAGSSTPRHGGELWQHAMETQFIVTTQIQLNRLAALCSDIKYQAPRYHAWNERGA